MTVEIHMKIEPDFVPVNLYIETARYLLALAGVKPYEPEKKNCDNIFNFGISTNESDSNGDNSNIETPAVELDSAKQAWDYRIHTSNKTKTLDGKWKMKRGVGDKLINKVTDDNKAALEASIPNPTVNEDCHNVTFETRVIPPPPPSIDLFPNFMKIATSKISDGKLNHSALVTMLQEKGIPDIPSIKIRPDLIPILISEIEKL